MTGSRWIFFDLGWTLVDETEAHLQRLEGLRRLGPPYSALSDTDFLELCEHHATRFAPIPFAAVLQALDPEGWESASGAAKYGHSGERLYAGVRGLLDRLGEYYHLGVIANQSEGTTDRLRDFGILDAFSVVVASAETGLKKPDPKILVHAQSLAGCAPEDATMVGDRLDNDITPAKAAGWRTIRVLQGFSRSQVPRSDAEQPDQTLSNVGVMSPDLI